MGVEPHVGFYLLAGIDFFFWTEYGYCLVFNDFIACCQEYYGVWNDLFFNK